MIGKKLLFIFMSLSLSVSSFSQQSSHEQVGARATDGSVDQHGGKGMGKGGMSMNMSHTRHHFSRDNGIGESYKGQQSPLSASDIDMNAAQVLYQNNCADCHGEQGLGDGARGADLEPGPTNIARFAKMKMAKDDYLLWTLSEGGEPVASEMPAFKGVLSVDEMWQIVAYLRQL